MISLSKSRNIGSDTWLTTWLLLIGTFIVVAPRSDFVQSLIFTEPSLNHLFEEVLNPQPSSMLNILSKLKSEL